MKLRMTLVLPGGALHDITLSCDVTATVADTARALIRAGVGADPALNEIAARRSAPVTLRVRSSPNSTPLLLDPASAIGLSGLQSGQVVEPIAEFGPHSQGLRVIDVAGYLEVLSGGQTGAIFSLIAGSNVVGRDPSCRVTLHDTSVSRRHAVIEVDDVFVLRDLGSANGLVIDDHVVSVRKMHRACTVMLGQVSLRITPGPPVGRPREHSHRQLHTRTPRVAPHFLASVRELPAPPAAAAISRIPFLAMLAPMMMGGAMFAVTHSPMSLMMVAFSPLMMMGSWIDGKLGGKRKMRRELAVFRDGVLAERLELESLHKREILVRGRETPTLPEVAAAISDRGSLLWSRRPEHRSFFEVRLGEGALPSRTELRLPSRGDTELQQWEVLRSIERTFREVTPVPVLERFHRCGSIGVAGEPNLADGMTRSLVLQLVGLHSPTEMVLACFSGTVEAQNWAWLQWLPHVDTVTSPLSVWQLANDLRSSNRLILALEGLLATRLARFGSRGDVRSHLDPNTRNDDAQGEAVSDVPTIPAVVVLVLDGSMDEGLVDRSRLIALAEQGPDRGIHLIWVSPDLARLPAACRTFAQLGTNASQVNFVRTATTVSLQRIEYIDATAALDLARKLSPIEDAGARVLDESDLPKSVHLRDLHPVDLLGGSAPIVEAWTHSGSLIETWTAGAERQPIALTAVLGQGPEGHVEIDLRLHGPHALVGGTTGAGKSEFLQSWIMSLAARVSPDRLTFLLIDYKGGAAFAECTELPHTVGLVTDLSPHLVRRALTSLRAELRHREELLAHHGAKDLITMERRSDAAAPPALIIVIDEFAALAKDVPEFVEGVIDIAQRGRSLGLHLIMATQRPAGVITDNLRANTNLRVALRMADETDSSDVVGVTDAAYFDAETPGRGAVKIGPGKISHFQTGFVGGRASAAHLDAQIEVCSLAFTEGEPWHIPAERRVLHREQTQRPRDIEQLRDAIVEASRVAGLIAPRRPWLDALPDLLDFGNLRALAAKMTEPAAPSDGREPRDVSLIGLRDQPSDQSQRPVFLDFEEVGNVAIIGASGTGKTCALITLAASLSQESVTRPVHLYAIDGGGGALGVITPLPALGAIAVLSDTELVGRILRTVLDAITERRPRYAAVCADGLAAFRRTPGGVAEARIVLMIDGLAAFRHSTETQVGDTSPFQMLGEIMRTGRSVGVHVVVTGDRPAAVPAALTSTLQQQFVLRLASPHDYAQLGLKADVLAESPAGRACIAGGTHEIQIALFGGSADFVCVAQAIASLAAALHKQGVPCVPRVRNAPHHVQLTELPREVLSAPVYGINTRTFAPVGVPTSGLGVIAGPAGSGLSTAALSCTEAMTRWAQLRGDRVEKVLLTFARDGMRTARAWDRVAFGEDEVRTAARELTAALGGKPAANGSKLGALTDVREGSIVGIQDAASPFKIHPQSWSSQRPQAHPSTSPPSFPSDGARGIIVVERPIDAEGTSAMTELVALAKVARRSEVLVLFEFEQGAGGAAWDLFAALKQPRWGLTLQPDAQESQSPFRESVGRVQRADFPPGRGFAIEGGRVSPVHVAVP